MQQNSTTTELEPVSPVQPKQKPPAPPPGGQPPKKSHKGWIWLVILIALGASAYYLWPRGNASQTDTADSKGAGKKGGRGAIPPVVAVKAQRGDIGVYYAGLGSVTPIYTVTVKTRVDGQLMTIHFKEGDLVKEGQLLIEIDPRPFQVQLEQAEGQLLKDQANLENAKVDLARYETLLKQNAIPEQQLATQKAQVTQDEGVVKTDQGVIDSSKLNLIYCKITAPITGRIGLRLVDPGNIVHASDTNGLLVITQVQPISVIFTVAEDQLPVVVQKLHSGVRLQVDAYDREMTTKLASGVLTTIDNQIDQSTGTLKLRAVFDNSRNELFPNQFVNARLLVEQKHNVILLPTAALQRNTNSTYVFLVKPDSTATVRQIKVGTTEGDESEITSGLQEGDVVVMTGVDKLTEGAKVHIAGSGGGGHGKTGGSGKGGNGSKGGGSGKGQRIQKVE